MSLQIVSPSEQIISASFAHTAATTAKTPLLIQSRLVIPLSTKDADELNTFVHSAEVDGIAKATGEAWVFGSLLYWDDTNKRLTTTSTSNTKAGYAIEPAASGDTVGGVVLLTPFGFGA